MSIHASPRWRPLRLTFPSPVFENQCRPGRNAEITHEDSPTITATSLLRAVETFIRMGLVFLLLHMCVQTNASAVPEGMRVLQYFPNGPRSTTGLRSFLVLRKAHTSGTASTSSNVKLDAMPAKNSHCIRKGTCLIYGVGFRGRPTFPARSSPGFQSLCQQRISRIGRSSLASHNICF